MLNQLQNKLLEQVSILQYWSIEKMEAHLTYPKYPEICEKL